MSTAILLFLLGLFVVAGLAVLLIALIIDQIEKGSRS